MTSTIETHEKSSSNWRIKPLLITHAVAILLLISWLIPPFNLVWQALDHLTFQFLNATLEAKPLLQIFWAVANIKSSDIFGALIMATFFLLYIAGGQKGEKKERFLHFIYIVLWAEVGILLAKEVIGRSLIALELTRKSPTLIYTDAIRLSEVIPWMKVKDISQWCFPSDHAEIALQWVLFVSYFCGLRFGLLALPWGVFFILPRLVSGAHWLSDAFCGSLCIVLILLAWAAFSPLYSLFMRNSLQGLNKIFSLLKKMLYFFKRKPVSNI